ncbi:hypothetical protein ADUPG1_009406 [Aduncisulcus paluster]|uniref:Uncharacterized protein n=1 Tax=Aduncisulcus paluster TaxID=2918883 RepID=A0ABQ5KVF6_9EUKA|nr:hypothetical protein ADUPG1_009406 [Aduncisulcus paluster]
MPKVIRFGLIYKKPALLVEYDNDAGRRRIRKIPVHGFIVTKKNPIAMDVLSAKDNLVKRNIDLLHPSVCSHDQLLDLLGRLRANLTHTIITRRSSEFKESDHDKSAPLTKFIQQHRKYPQSSAPLQDSSSLSNFTGNADSRISQHDSTHLSELPTEYARSSEILRELGDYRYSSDHPKDFKAVDDSKHYEDHEELTSASYKRSRRKMKIPSSKFDDSQECSPSIASKSPSSGSSFSPSSHNDETSPHSLSPYSKFASGAFSHLRRQQVEAEFGDAERLAAELIDDRDHYDTYKEKDEVIIPIVESPSKNRTIDARVGSHGLDIGEYGMIGRNQRMGAYESSPLFQDASGDMSGEHGDMSGEHGDMSGEHGDMSGEHGDMSGEHGDMSGEHGDMSGDSSGMSAGVDQVRYHEHSSIASGSMGAGFTDLVEAEAEEEEEEWSDGGFEKMDKYHIQVHDHVSARHHVDHQKRGERNGHGDVVGTYYSQYTPGTPGEGVASNSELLDELVEDDLAKVRNIYINPDGNGHDLVPTSGSAIASRYDLRMPTDYDTLLSGSTDAIGFGAMDAKYASVTDFSNPATDADYKYNTIQMHGEFSPTHEDQPIFFFGERPGAFDNYDRWGLEAQDLSIGTIFNVNPNYLVHNGDRLWNNTVDV